MRPVVEAEAVDGVRAREAAEPVVLLEREEVDAASRQFERAAQAADAEAADDDRRSHRTYSGTPVRAGPRKSGRYSSHVIRSRYSSARRCFSSNPRSIERSDRSPANASFSTVYRNGTPSNSS